MIYIDTNIFIYAIENHPEYGEACKRILVDVEKGKLKACASILVLVDIINVLTKMNKIIEKRAENLWI